MQREKRDGRGRKGKWMGERMERRQRGRYREEVVLPEREIEAAVYMGETDGERAPAAMEGGGEQ